MAQNQIKSLLAVLAAIIFLSSSVYADDDVVWKKEINSEFKPNSVIFSPDGSKIYCSGNGGYTILDTESGEVLEKIEGNYGPILRFSPDGRFIYTKKYYKLDAETLEPILNANHRYGHMDMNPNCDVIVAGTSLVDWEPRERIIVVNPENMEKYESFDHQGRVYEVAVSPNAKYFVTNSRDGGFDETHYDRLTLWSLETYSKVRILADMPSGTSISNLTFSPDGSMFAAQIDDTIRIWDTGTWEKLNHIECIEEMPCTNLIFSLDSKYIVTGLRSQYDWTTNIRQISPCSTIHTYESMIYSTRGLDISKNSKYILSYSSDLYLLNARWEPSGINAEEEPTMIYPNPTSGMINIDINPTIQYSVQISDMVGNPVNHEEISGRDVYTFDVSSLQPGTYFLQLSSQTSNVTYKFIKE